MSMFLDILIFFIAEYNKGGNIVYFKRGMVDYEQIRENVKGF